MRNVKKHPSHHSSLIIPRSSFLLLFVLLLSFSPPALARGARRVVVIKVDGLPFDTLERFVRERDPRTGKSLLPWFEHVFYDGGTRVSNFYVRGMSLSAPSWWAAIRKTPQAADTALVVVSDHGINSDPRFYSQGFNLVKLLGSREGGGHHVVTKRRLMADYALKGIYPLVPLIYTTTEESFYLKGRSTDYPTALVDFDGNERSTVHLRDSDLNLVHILLLQLKRSDLPEPLRRAATDALFDTIERRRAEWQNSFDNLKEELGALHGLVERQRALVETLPEKFTKADMDAGRDKAARREAARLDSWQQDERSYGIYAQTLANLLALDRARFNPSAVNIEDLIPKRAMGEQNTIHELQNYVVGLAPGGLAVSPDGSLDTERGFARVNYFSLLGGVNVRNNVQPGVESKPIDFVAARVPVESLRGALRTDEDADEAVWLYAAPDSQALVLSRVDSGRLLLRYLPVANLRQDARGRVSFDRVDFRAGLPLKIWEDEKIALPQGVARGRWLSGWHTDLEWERAEHRTKYSIAVVGLEEQFGRHTVEGTQADAPGINADERLLRRFRWHQRLLVEGDLLVVANDHWNFDVRGFNSGGNHGSFLRVSTHATLLFAGGERTGIPRGLNVTEPYDSLSFAPTILALTGRLEDGTGRPVLALWRQGFRTFPGRVISELFNTPAPEAPLADTTDEPEEKH